MFAAGAATRTHIDVLQRLRGNKPPPSTFTAHPSIWNSNLHTSSALALPPPSISPATPGLMNHTCELAMLCKPTAYVVNLSSSGDCNSCNYKSFHATQESCFRPSWLPPCQPSGPVPYAGTCDGRKSQERPLTPAGQPRQPEHLTSKPQRGEIYLGCRLCISVTRRGGWAMRDGLYMWRSATRRPAALAASTHMQFRTAVTGRWPQSHRTIPNKCRCNSGWQP